MLPELVTAPERLALVVTVAALPETSDGWAHDGSEPPAMAWTKLTPVHDPATGTVDRLICAMARFPVMFAALPEEDDETPDQEAAEPDDLSPAATGAGGPLSRGGAA